MSKYFVPFWKEVYYIRKEFAPREANSFLIEFALFQKGIGVREDNQEVTKIASL